MPFNNSVQVDLTEIKLDLILYRIHPYFEDWTISSLIFYWSSWEPFYRCSNDYSQQDVDVLRSPDSQLKLKSFHHMYGSFMQLPLLVELIVALNLQYLIIVLEQVRCDQLTICCYQFTVCWGQLTVCYDRFTECSFAVKWSLTFLKVKLAMNSTAINLIWWTDRDYDY